MRRDGVVGLPGRPQSADDLAGRARAGDREAFAELVVLTSPQVFALAKRLVGNGHDASDVLQETYLRAFRSIGKFRGDAAATTWLYRITANCAATHLRRRRWSKVTPVDEALVLADPLAEERVLEAGDASSERERLRRALEGLPDLLRAVVVLRDVYDLPHETIAKELGISRGAAKVRLHRARRRLRELLPSPAELAGAGKASSTRRTSRQAGAAGDAAVTYLPIAARAAMPGTPAGGGTDRARAASEHERAAVRGNRASGL